MGWNLSLRQDMRVHMTPQSELMGLISLGNKMRKDIIALFTVKWDDYNASNNTRYENPDDFAEYLDAADRELDYLLGWSGKTPVEYKQALEK